MTRSVDVDKVRGKQRNHGDFHLPASVCHLRGMPLYRIVAWWGFYLGRAFNRDDLSAAFQIDLRRASGILNYLTRRNVGDDITLDVHLHPVRGGHSRMAVHILAVKPTVTPVREARLRGPRASGRTTKKHDRLMARWLLSRPAGSDPDSLAAWKAACPQQETAC